MTTPIDARALALFADANFWPYVGKTADCWVWTRATTNGGYGVLRHEGRKVYAHRFSLLIEHGSWPPAGLVTDHLCRNRSCVRPDHLEVVTPAENTRRGEALAKSLEWSAAITNCPAGHPYTPENTYINPTSRSRRCRICRREQARARRLANPDHANLLSRRKYWRKRGVEI